MKELIISKSLFIGPWILVDSATDEWSITASKAPVAARGTDNLGVKTSISQNALEVRIPNAGEGKVTKTT